MGAHSETSNIKGATLKEAYQSAVDEARAEFGYDGYNGTISTTNGVFLAAPLPMLQHDALRLAQQLINERKVEKWGNVGAIRLAEPKDPRTFTVEVNTTGLDYDRRAIAINDAVKKKMRAAEGIVNISSVDDNTTRVVGTKQTPAHMEYQVWWRGQLISRHTSMTAARTEAIRCFNVQKTYPGGIRQSVIVRAAKVRDEGNNADLFCVSEEVTKTVTTVTATVAKPHHALNEWVIAGIYAE